MGKLLATGGISQVAGAGGGGLAPWGLTPGTARATAIAPMRITPSSKPRIIRPIYIYGAAVGITDRIELSLAKQEFRGTGGARDGLKICQDIVAVKVKLAGDAVVDQDRALPQIAVGIMVKRNNGVSRLGAITGVTQRGAKKDHGIDYYLSATKILLDQSLLLNGTLRATKANQMGLLRFGGDLRDRYQPMLEVSAAYLLNRNLAVGAEYRMKPRNLGDDKEKDYYDAFIAWFPNKNLSITAAYVALGNITVLNPKRQKGYYLSLQAGF
jgi:hypothetical protein